MAIIRTKRSPGKSSVKPKKPVSYQLGNVNPYLNVPSWGGYSGDDMYDPSALPDYRYQPWYPQAFPNANIPANAYWQPQTGAPALATQPVTAQPATALPEGYQYPYWNEKNAGAPAYKWVKNKETGDIELKPNEDAAPGAPPPEEGWTSSYSKAFYSTQPKDKLLSIWGGGNRRTMGTRSWRVSSRISKFLEKIAEKDEDEKPAGNITAGPNVSWRT
jgi:hypothetical protein